MNRNGLDAHDSLLMQGIDKNWLSGTGNFARSELTDAQRAEHHVRREEILKRKGLVSDGPGRPKKNSEKSSSYSQQASETLGISKRTVEKDLARGKKIAPDVLAEVAGTDLDKGVALVASESSE